MSLHDPETARIMQAAEEAQERLQAAIATVQQAMIDGIRRDLEQAARPVCPCCHRPMTDEEDQP